MRRLTLLVLIALVVPLACKKPEAGGDAGADGAASASASASAAPSDSSSASATATAVHYGPPAAGNGCRAGVDTNACAADKLEELICSGGVWHVMQTCRGPGACTGTGAATGCDLGTPVVGDVCVANATNFTCIRRQVLHSCVGGKWTESLCTPPQWCHPAGNGGPIAGCRM